MNSATRLVIPILLLLAFLVATSATGSAATIDGRQVYWTDYNANTLNAYPVGGGSSQVVATTGSSPNGVAIDRATGRVYWAERDSNAIVSSAPDGSDVQTLASGAPNVATPVGVAIDGRTRTAYWANSNSSTIGWAKLDGSTIGVVDAGTAVVSHPQGLAVDPFEKRVYWTNTAVPAGDPVISWAATDGSGISGSLGAVGGAVTAVGLDIDLVGGRVFWTSYANGGVYAQGLDGSAPVVLAGSGVVTGAGGAALDAATGRLYVSDYNGSSLVAMNDNGTDAVAAVTATSPWGAPAISGTGALTAPAGLPGVVAAAGQTGSVTARIANSGNYPIQIYSYDFGASGRFGGGTGCPDILANGASCDLTITYSATTADAATGTLTVATDAGPFSFTLSGGVAPSAPTAARISALRAAKRCSSRTSAGSLSIGFNSATAMRVTATLQRSTTRLHRLPTRCPARARYTDYQSRMFGKRLSRRVDVAAGRQTATVRQLFKARKLASGRYRLLLTYTDAQGKKQSKGTWFWVLR